MRKLTIAISVMFLLGSSVELYDSLKGVNDPFFNDYPIAIAGWFLIAFLFIGAVFSFGNLGVFKVLAITATTLSALGYVISGLYNAYAGFGLSFEVLPYLILPMLLTIVAHGWYVQRVLQHGKDS